MQLSGVYHHAVHLHFGQHAHQRHLYFPEELLHVGLLQLRLKNVFQPQGDVGILAGILVHLARSKAAHTPLLLSLRSDELVDVDGAVVEVDLRHVVHVVAELGLDEVMGYHGVEQLAAHLDTIVHQHLYIVFDVLSNFQYRLVFVEWTENVDYLLSLLPLGWHGNVKCLLLLDGEAQTHQFGLHCVG